MQTNIPTTIILHGGNNLGVKLAETLSTQKSHLIIIDEFTRSTKDSIKIIRKTTGAEAYDISAIPTLMQNLKRVDYIIILLERFLSANRTVSSKKFLSETNSIDALCKLALEQGAKVIMTTSLDLHRRISVLQNTQTETLRDVSGQKPYTTVELQRYCENLVAEYHDQSMLNARITRIGELMGEGIDLGHGSVFIQMLKESVTKPRITIPGEGLDSSYYVHLYDTVYGIIKALFSNKTNGEVYTLAYSEEISSLNLAYKLLEMNPNATEIAFGSDTESVPPSQIYVPAKNLSKLGWAPKISFEQALHETLEYCFKTYKVTWKDKPEPFSHSPLNTSVSDEKKTREKRSDRSEYVTPFGTFVRSVTKPFQHIHLKTKQSLSSIKQVKLNRENLPKNIATSFLFLIVFIFLFGPLIQVTTGAVTSYYFAKDAYQKALELDIDHAKTSISRTQYTTKLMQDGWHTLRWISIIPPARDFYTQTSNLISAANHAAAGGGYLLLGAEPYVDYFKNFEPLNDFNETAGGGSREYTEELEMMQERESYLESAHIELSLAQNLLSGVDTDVYPNTIAKRLRSLDTMTAKSEETLITLEEFAAQAPQFLGIDGRKTYIILFQNPMELRSTGGWITSVGIVGIERGQIRKLEVKDVYDIDGRITDTIPAPESMQNELDVTDWTLSLANWSPDFPITAEAVEYFLTLSGDAVSVDGVIAIDLEFVRSLVDIWGEIQVPGESEPVTADNLYDKVIEIHRAFTPGSTRKPLFLSNLANEIMQGTFSSSKDNWPEIAEKVATALAEKHILVFFDDPALNSVMTSNGWSGQLEPAQNIFYPVEWNWGGNKANYFLDRSTDISVTITDKTKVQQTATVTYQNSSTTTTYPEGDYINFVRIYLPYGAKITRIDGLTRTSVTQDTSLGLAVVSGWITVPVTSERSYTISYLLEQSAVEDFPLIEASHNTFSYTLNAIKQPGLDEDPITLRITYPDSWTPVDTTDFRRELNSLIHLDQFEQDKAVTVTWEE